MRFILFLLLSVAYCAIYALIGGTRLLFAYPAYLLIAGAGVLSLAAFLTARSRPNAIVLASMTLLAGYVALRAWNSPYIYYARPNLLMTGACVIVYLLTAFYLTEARERLRLFTLFMVIAVGQIGLGFYQFLSGHGFQFGFTRPDTLIYDGLTRASGMFISPNHFAGYLEAVAMFALGFAAWARSGLAERIVAGLVAVGCYAGVAISISRGGMLSSAFSLLIFLSLCAVIVIRLRPKKALAIVALMLAGLFVVGSSLIVFAGQSKTIANRAERIVAHDIRYANWAATMDQFRLAPLLGTGAGTHIIYGRLFRREELQVDPIHAHSDYLEMLAEYGIVGAGLSVIFLVCHLGNGLISVRRFVLRLEPEDPDTPPPRAASPNLAITLGALGVIAALLAHSVVDFNMHIPGNALLYAFAFGILANPGGEGHRRLRTLSFSGLHRIAACGVGILLIYSIVPKIQGAWHTEQARIHLRDGRYRDAEKAALLATRHATENPYAWLYLGESYRWQALTSRFGLFRDRMNEKAVDALKRGVDVIPVEINLLTRYAQALDALGRHDEAEVIFQRALECDPLLGSLRGFYGYHLLLMGKEKEGEEAIRQAHRLGGDEADRAAKNEYQWLTQEIVR